MIGRLLWLGGCLLFGAVIGLVGAFVQAHRLVVPTPWEAVALPWGALIVLVTLIAAIRAGAWAAGTRWGAWAVLLGWLAATVAMAAESASGDLALSGGTRQLVYLFAGVIIGSAAATLPLPASRNP